MLRIFPYQQRLQAIWEIRGSSQGTTRQSAPSALTMSLEPVLLRPSLSVRSLVDFAGRRCTVLSPGHPWPDMRTEAGFGHRMLADVYITSVEYFAPPPGLPSTTVAQVIPNPAL